MKTLAMIDKHAKQSEAEFCFFLINGVKLYANYFGSTDEGDLIISTNNGGQQIVMRSAISSITFPDGNTKLGAR